MSYVIMGNAQKFINEFADIKKIVPKKPNRKRVDFKRIIGISFTDT